MRFTSAKGGTQISSLTLSNKQTDDDSHLNNAKVAVIATLTVKRANY